MFIVRPTREEMVAKLNEAADGFGESIHSLLDTYPDRWALHSLTVNGETQLMTRDDWVRHCLRVIRIDGRGMSESQLAAVESRLLDSLDLWKDEHWTVTDAVSKRVNDLHAALIAETA